MRVIGLDTSLTRTGVAIIDSWARSTTAHSIVTKEPGAETSRTRIERIEYITAQVMSRIGTLDETLVVIEGNAQSSRMGKVWDRAGLWWNIVFTLDASGVPFAICPPNTRAKWATGKGNAHKDDVGIAIDRMWHDIGTNNDERDALCLATMGAQYLGWPVQTLSRHRTALAAVEWPEADKIEPLRWPLAADQGGPRVTGRETADRRPTGQPAANAGKVAE